MADAILHETSIVDVDEMAHRYEHSIEVQLPFLQFLYGDNFKIVPICFLMQDYDSAVEVGRALVEALDATNTVVIASSDMTHYEPAKVAAAKDHAALKAVTDMDAKRFYETVESQKHHRLRIRTHNCARHLRQRRMCQSPTPKLPQQRRHNRRPHKRSGLRSS